MGQIEDGDVGQGPFRHGCSPVGQEYQSRNRARILNLSCLYCEHFPLDFPCEYPTIGLTYYTNFLTISDTRRWSYVAPIIWHDQTTVHRYVRLDLRSGSIWGFCCSSSGTATQAGLLGLSVSALER